MPTVGSDCRKVGGRGHPACVRPNRKVEIESLASTAKVYPIIVTEGTAKGSPRKFVFHFDGRHWQYFGPPRFDPEPGF